MAPVIKAGLEHLKNAYNLEKKVLGTGSFGKVFMATSSSDKTHKVAIKVIKKDKLSPEEI